MEELDSNTLVIAGLLLAALIAEMRLLRRELQVFLAALVERSRRRDMRRQRRETSDPHIRRPEAVPEFGEEENTDLHELMELEREQMRSRRTTDRRRHAGERSPRPGTHADEPFEK